MFGKLHPRYFKTERKVQVIHVNQEVNATEQLFEIKFKISIFIVKKKKKRKKDCFVFKKRSVTNCCAEMKWLLIAKLKITEITKEK